VILELFGAMVLTYLASRLMIAVLGDRRSLAGLLRAHGLAFVLLVLAGTLVRGGVWLGGAPLYVPWQLFWLIFDEVRRGRVEASIEKRKFAARNAR